MLCPSCSHETREDVSFCRDCGTRLSVACPNCRCRLPLGAKFCDSCGSRLTSYTSPTATERHQEGSESGSEREPEPLPTSFGGGRYEVRQFLGAGATKKVDLVHDTVLDRDVAFALIRAPGIDESDLRRILREAQTMARLGDHPNIVSIYEYGEEGGAPFMVLPMMAGGSVQHLIATAAGKKPKIETVLRIATDVCKGLEFAHSNGVVHRDVKPGNLWLTADGVAKIGDFGIALSPTHSRMTNSGVILGTVAYIAPEQATGAAVDERSDLYSFGAVLYELVSGRPPFTGEHPVAIIGQHINTMAVAPSRYNPKCPSSRLEGLILQLLAKEPVDRLKSASEVLAVLASTSEADLARKGKPGRGKSRKTPLQVLIAEDSEDDSMLLLRELRKGGFDPTHKRVDTPAAMKSALENGTWDVIIADYSMPQFTAPAALKLMQDSGLDIPFIIMSGTVSEETAVAAMKAGANDYVMKNNLARIVPAVERELAEAEERRERRRAEQEGTQLHRQLEERQADLEKRVESLTAQNGRLQSQMAQYSELIRAYGPVFSSVERLADDAGALAERLRSMQAPALLDLTGMGSELEGLPGPYRRLEGAPPPDWIGGLPAETGPSPSPHPCPAPRALAALPPRPEWARIRVEMSAGCRVESTCHDVSCTLPLGASGTRPGCSPRRPESPETPIPLRRGQMPPTTDELRTRVEELEQSNQRLRLELSERAREEKALGNRVDELAAMNRELEAFSSSLLHDLRAPLRSIDGFSLALLEDCGDSLGEQGKDYLRRARAASERMEQMIDRLLDLARATGSEVAPVPVDLSGLSHEIAEELQYREPERQVECSIQEGLGVNGDPQLLRMAMENLLGNAWKFTGRHPQARIEVGVTTGGGDGPAYFVRDDGAGFDMAYVDKLFNPFQRVHPAEEFEGTGIGLATVKRVVLRHGGRVWAEGKVEKGATFYFTL